MSRCIVFRISNVLLTGVIERVEAEDAVASDRLPPGTLRTVGEKPIFMRKREYAMTEDAAMTMARALIAREIAKTQTACERRVEKLRSLRISCVNRGETKDLR